MTKRLDLILNGKGGVGKSFFAVNLVQYFKDKQIPYVAIDSDNENSTLKRFHPDAEFMDLAEARDMDGMFSALERNPLALVDCRAASTDVFFDYFQEIDMAETLRVLDAELTIIMPVNHESDSLEQVQSVVKQFGNSCRYVVLRNAVHSDSFALYDKSKVRQRLNAELGGREISMERLRPWLVEGLQRANLTITHASRHADFPLLDRQRLQTWQRHLYGQIESVADLLLPAQPTSAARNEKDRLL